MFSQHYPTLERMKYETRTWDEVMQIDQLKLFLEKHTKLKHFECDYRFLWANRNLLNETNVQLDLLTVWAREWNMAELFDQFVDFLKQLYERGFYKILHLSFFDIWNPTLNYFFNAMSTLPALEILSYVYPLNSLSRFTNLKEFRAYRLSDSATEIEIVAKSLIKLEQLTVDNATVDDILPFIRYSKRLKAIRILKLRKNSILDLFRLNEERKKLGNPRQVVIYVREDVYLYKKWQSKNLNLSYVKITRFHN